MPNAIDILTLFPELTGIGQIQLQVYCSEWVQRPVARKYGIVQIVIERDLRMRMLLDESSMVFYGKQVFVPIDELLGYIIDRHFVDADEGKRVHANIRDGRSRMDEAAYNFEVVGGRVGTLYLVCKNPNCNAEFMTEQKAVNGQTIQWAGCDVTCDTCGQTYAYDNRDFKLKFAEQR